MRSCDDPRKHFLRASVCMCAGELYDATREVFRGPVINVVKVKKTYRNERLTGGGVECGADQRVNLCPRFPLAAELS